MCLKRSTSLQAYQGICALQGVVERDSGLGTSGMMGLEEHFPPPKILEAKLFFLVSAPQRGGIDGIFTEFLK